MRECCSFRRLTSARFNHSVNDTTLYTGVLVDSSQFVKKQGSESSKQLLIILVSFRFSLKLVNYMVFNSDETHFIINTDDGKTFDIKGTNKIKYHDVASGGQGMTLMVKLRGRPNARIETPMLIFTNANSSYPISRGRIQCSWSNISVWAIRMDGSPRFLWMATRKQVYEKRPVRQKASDFLDSAAGHKALDSIPDLETRQRVQDVVKSKRVEIRFFTRQLDWFMSACGHHSHPKVEASVVWRVSKEKMGFAKQRDFAKVPNEKGDYSGKLLQPGKSYYLKLAAKCCRLENEMRDPDDGVSLVRKDMIRCGLGKNLKGMREEKQLFQIISQAS